MVKLKICYNDDIRIYKTKKLNILDIFEFCSKKFGLADVNLFYKDSDGDEITIVSNNDLDDAMHAFSSKMGKIYVRKSDKQIRNGERSLEISEEEDISISIEEEDDMKSEKETQTPLKKDKKKIKKSKSKNKNNKNNKNNNNNKKSKNIQINSKETLNIKAICKCGHPMQALAAKKCYSWAGWVYCDSCNKKLVNNDLVYHCPRDKQKEHKRGYDYCVECAKKYGMSKKEYPILSKVCTRPSKNCKEMKNICPMKMPPPPPFGFGFPPPPPHGHNGTIPPPPPHLVYYIMECIKYYNENYGNKSCGCKCTCKDNKNNNNKNSSDEEEEEEEEDVVVLIEKKEKKKKKKN